MKLVTLGSPQSTLYRFLDSMLFITKFLWVSLARAITLSSWFDLSSSADDTCAVIRIALGNISINGVIILMMYLPH